MCAGASVVRAVRAVQAARAVRAVSASSASVRRGRGVGRCLRGPGRRCPGCSSGQKVSFAACGKASSDHPGVPGRVRVRVRVRVRMRRVCSSGRTMSFAASGRTSSDHPGSRGGIMSPARREPRTTRAPHDASQHYASPARREHHGTTRAPRHDGGPARRACGASGAMRVSRRRQCDSSTSFASVPRYSSITFGSSASSRPVPE